MNKLLRFFSLITVTAILISFTSCRSFKPIKVGSPNDFQVHSVNTQRINASIYLPIKNPNLFSVKIKEIHAIAYVNDTKTGNVINSETLKIPANSNKTQKLTFDIDLSDMVSGGISIFSILRDRKVDLKLEGTVTAKALFTKRKINFSEERTIRLKD